MRAPLIALCLLASCRAAPPPPEDGARPPTALAERPSPLGSDLAPAPRATQTATQGPRGTTTAREEPAPPTRSRLPFRTIGEARDARDDAGLAAPPYADLARVRVQDDGRAMRAVVDLGEAVPSPFPSGEQIAVGVDFYRSASQQESDYQVYAIGDEEGWLAYLDTPRGFVEYPGRFELGGGRLAFTVPWASIGGMPAGSFSSFLDWDREQPVVNAAAADRAPDTGRAAFARSS